MAYLRQRPKDRPFCLCYQFKAPPGPWEPDPRFHDAFKGVAIPLPPGFGEPQPEGAPAAFSKTTQEIANMGDFFHKAERPPPLVDRHLPEDERLHAVPPAYFRNYYRALLDR